MKKCLGIITRICNRLGACASGDLSDFSKRIYDISQYRSKDWRSEYARDKARIIHGSAFRRLQGKTQVMGAGEGDFHRTRLTHTLEVCQIGVSLLQGIVKGVKGEVPADLKPYIAESNSQDAQDLIAAACYAHDLGHPPFGHGGEKALHSVMKHEDGFEGNAQTIRILLKLEKYYKNKGIDPTRRTILAVLKYPASYRMYIDKGYSKDEPPKCYYSVHEKDLKWVFQVFKKEDVEKFTLIKKDANGMKTMHMSFDASVMECADDIAYASHDLEDIVARKIIPRYMLIDKVDEYYKNCGTTRFGTNGNAITIDDFKKLFKDSYERKRVIGKIVNSLMSSTKLIQKKEFSHPLLDCNLQIDEDMKGFLRYLKKDITYKLVVSAPEVQMLERKGKMVVKKIFRELKQCPEMLIPHWKDLDTDDSKDRRVCDYIAGMTDPFAVKIYNRLFTPGFGTSTDEM